MVWLAVDKDGTEVIYEEIPVRLINVWRPRLELAFIELPKGSIAKLIGRELTWEDEPVKLE